MTGREGAWRVLAEEFNSSIVSERGVGERPTHYVVSPLGIRMNRVLVAGELSVPEAVGTTGNSPFYRARLLDPTGSIMVTAGGYQPRAAAQLRALTEAGHAMVVGKAQLLLGRDAPPFPSVRAEAIRLLDLEEYRVTLAEIANQTLDRIETIRSGSVGPRLPRTGSDPGGSTSFDTGRLLVGLTKCLAALEAPPVPYLDTATSTPSSSFSTRSPIRITRLSDPTASRPSSAAEHAQESTVLDILDDLAEATIDGYANRPQVVQGALARGIPELRLLEILRRLQETGAVEEPIGGKLRRP